MSNVLGFPKKKDPDEPCDTVECDVVFSTMFETESGEKKLISMIRTQEKTIELGITEAFDPNDGGDLIDMAGDNTIYLCDDSDGFVFDSVKKWLEQVIQKKAKDM